jgi:hypothetical protein
MNSAMKPAVVCPPGCIILPLLQHQPLPDCMERCIRVFSSGTLYTTVCHTHYIAKQLVLHCLLLQLAAAWGSLHQRGHKLVQQLHPIK